MVDTAVGTGEEKPYRLWVGFGWFRKVPMDFGQTSTLSATIDTSSSSKKLKLDDILDSSAGLDQSFPDCHVNYWVIRAHGPTIP